MRRVAPFRLLFANIPAGGSRGHHPRSGQSFEERS